MFLLLLLREDVFVRTVPIRKFYAAADAPGGFEGVFSCEYGDVISDRAIRHAQLVSQTPHRFTLADGQNAYDFRPAFICIHSFTPFPFGSNLMVTGK